MKFTLHTEARTSLIRGYQPGQVRLYASTVEHDAFLLARPGEPPRVERWRVGDLAELTEQDVAPVLEARPDVLIVGTGDSQRFLPPALHALFARRGIGLEVMDTAAACRTYNILVLEDRRVAAALIV